MSAATHDLALLAINLTRRCNQSCAHCYLDASTLRATDADELTTVQVKRLLDDVAAMQQGTMVVLTGGEPLIRNDLETLIQYGASLNLPMVIGSNGMMLTQRRVESLQAAGLLGVGISLDSLDPAVHDRFRGHAGAWSKTMAGIECCRRAVVDFQLHFSITDATAEELPSMAEFAYSSGARALNVFFTVCVGRASSLRSVTQQRYESLLAEIIRLQSEYPGLILRPRCAPHFKRIAHQLQPQALTNRISGRDGDGCIAGIHYARVNQHGGVTACPYIEKEVGNIHQQPFSEIWADAEDFRRLREPQLNGKCGACEYRALCGGCRARPLARGLDLMDADDLCTYQPDSSVLLEEISTADGRQPSWSSSAEQRLSRVPDFLRNMVRKRAEAYVMGLGEDQVKTEHLSQLTAARFGASGPPKSFSRSSLPIQMGQDR